MSEIIQRRMDYMAEELNELRKTKLFNNDEFRNIRQKIRSFEDKIHSVTKVLQDFKDYIRFEKDLWKEIRTRRGRSKTNERSSSLEHKIIRRIKNLFETALQRFSNEITLCLEYFKFCKQVNYIDAACTAIDSMIKHHMDKPEVWQVAGAWYAYDRNNMGRATEIILKGLTLHPTSKLLYTGAIQCNLSAANKSENGDANQKVCCGKLKTYISEILSNITEVEYYMEVLKLLEQHEFTAPVQSYFIEEILKKHADKEFVWHTLAQREKNGQHFRKENDDDNVKSDFPTRISLCFGKYQEGLKKVSEQEKPALWAKYLDCLIETREESNCTDVTKNFLKQVMKQACEEKCLPEKYFVIWLELVDDDEALDVLQKAVILFPKSVELWNLLLRYHILKDVPDEVNKVFESGILALEEKSLQLWLAIIRYHVLTSRDDVVESIYKDGIKQPREVSDQLKIHYIEWLALTKDIKAARVVYNSLADEKPYCKELHKTMSKLESAEIKYNLEEWKNVHELACRQFGKEDVDVWIDYIYFYAHFNKGEDLNENIQAIYKRAESELSPLLKSYFIHKYNEILATV